MPKRNPSIGDEPTERQQELLDWLAQFIDQHGYSPTFREIGDGLGLVSTGPVYCLTSSLARKGLIDWVPGKARSMRPIDRVQYRDKVSGKLYQVHLESVQKMGFGEELTILCLAGDDSPAQYVAVPKTEFKNFEKIFR